MANKNSNLFKKVFDVTKNVLSFVANPALYASQQLAEKVVAPAAKVIAQAAPRAVIATAIEPVAAIINKPAVLKPETKLQKALLGEEPITSIFKETSDAILTIIKFLSNKGVPSNLSTSISLAIAPVFVGGMTSLDLTPIGGEKNAAKSIAKSKDLAFIIEKIKPIFNKASDEVLADIAKPLIEISKASDVKEYLQKTVSDAFKSDPNVSVVQKIIKVLEEAKPIRKQQETIYSAERAKRLEEALKLGQIEPTEAGAFKSLAALKGELPKVDFESLRSQVSQEEIDSVFKTIVDSPALQGFDKIKATKALGKIFGEFGGAVPTEGELSLLNRVFPKELTESLLAKQPLLKRVMDVGYDVASIPRSLMASLDVSAPLRQGIFLAARNPKVFIKELFNQFKYFGSQNAFDIAQRSVVESKFYPLAEESGLSLTELGQLLGKREEKFASPLAEKIPLVGGVVKASGRAYTGFLNKLRMDVFSDLVTNAQKIGRDPLENKDLAKEIANFVNAASGRGQLTKQLEPAAKTLNALFFSPRLMASRLTLLNPLYYVKADPFVRKEALKSLFAFTGMIGTIGALSTLAGAKVSTNTNSADFSKIKIGNTRLDLAGGFSQYVVAASRLLSGKYVSTTSGKESSLGAGYKPTTRYDIAVRTLENKEAPVASFVTTLLKQQNPLGQKINIKDEIVQRFTPMIISDIVDLAKDDPKLIPLAALGALGGGLQTYSNKPALKPYKPTTQLKPYRPALKPYKP